MALPENVKPSSSTVATASLGMAAGVVVVFIVNQVMKANGLEELPGEVAASVGTIIATLVGLPFNGGRSQDTE